MAEAAALKTPDQDAFLGVEHSLAGKRWRLRLTDERAALMLSQHLEVPEIVGRILSARGVTPEEGADFLDPTLRHYMPDPSSLNDMEVAAARIRSRIASASSPFPCTRNWVQ